MLVTQLWVPGGAWALAPPGSGSDCRRSCGANFRSPRVVAVLQLETESGGLWTPVFQGWHEHHDGVTARVLSSGARELGPPS